MFIKSLVKETTIFTVLVSCIWCELAFNNVKDKMALKLFKLMPEKNLVVSTLLVRFPLCKLATIATGEAKTELMSVLGFTNDTWMLGCYARFRDIITTLSKAELTYTNQFYVDYNDNIDPAFLTHSVINFGVSVNKVGFNYPHKAVQFINHLISTATYKRVTDVLDSNDINQNTSMLILSAINFKCTWETPFNYKRTEMEVFHYTKGNTAKVPMMNHIDSLFYVDGGEFQAVKIGLATPPTSVIFVLPFDRRGLPSLINKAYSDRNYFAPLFNLMRPKTVKLKIPRFKIKTYVDWTGFLQEMGLYAIFNCTSSDLSRILKEELRNNVTICVNKVKQKTFIEIDEMGVTRQVLTDQRTLMWEDMAPKSAPLINSVDLIFNRPFLFFVNIDFTETNRHELFTGVYYGPE